MSVINFISSWLKDIVVLFILISIAELIMPKGNMKKYINLVIGLLIIFTIISPFARLIKLDFSLEQAIFNYSKSSDYEESQGNEFHLQQEKQIESLYKEKISKEVMEIVESETAYKIVDISVGVFTGEENYGEIDYFKLIVAEKDSEINSSKISIEKIESIEINNQANKNKSNNSKENSEYAELKKIISSRYSIEKEKIIIKGIGERNE